MDPVKVLNLRTLVVPIDDVIPNPWNPNRQDAATFKAERESIREFGFIDPVTVRPHPEQDGKWQIIDGEHRWKGAKEEGYDEILIADIGPISDESAKKLTVIFNETRGEADIAAMGKLLHELSEALDDGEALALGLPFSRSELDHLLQIGQVDWDEWAAGQPQGRTRGQSAATLREYVLLCTDEQFDDMTRFAGMVQRENELDTNTEAHLAVLREAAGKL